MSSGCKIPRGEFRNPHPDPKNAAAKAAVDSLLATVKEAHGRFGDPTPEDYAIAAHELGELQRLMIVERRLTFRQVVESRIRLTIKASLETHCLAAFPYQEALKRADGLDEEWNGHGLDEVTEGHSLAGLVFSVKDCIHVDGFPTTLGCSSRAHHNEQASAELVLHLIERGGIMIAKTTAPQLMMSNTTESPLWGTTRSSIKSAADNGHGGPQEFQVGGSSGGDASLVKMGGSQLGIGTDMGGSIRQPACLNELYGFKFTSTPPGFRWALPNDFMTGLPHTTVPATAPGLLGRHCSTVKLAAEVLGRAKNSNSKVLTEDKEPSSERQDVGNNPRLVYTAQHSSPEVQELIQWLVDHLKDNEDALLRPKRSDALGEVDLQAWGEAWMEPATQHGFDDARAMLADDPLITRTLFDEERLDVTDEKREAWKADTAKLDGLKQAFLRQARLGAKTDDDENVFFVTPTYILGTPVPSRTFITLDDTGASEIWCEIFNLLDWPCISVPLVLPRTLRERIRNAALASPSWARHLTGLIEADPVDGGEPRLPRLSVQLASLPGKERELLEYAARIERAHLG